MPWNGQKGEMLEGYLAALKFVAFVMPAVMSLLGGVRGI